jgi:hypothetical protein
MTVLPYLLWRIALPTHTEIVMPFVSAPLFHSGMAAIAATSAGDFISTRVKS